MEINMKNLIMVVFLVCAMFVSSSVFAGGEIYVKDKATFNELNRNLFSILPFVMACKKKGIENEKCFCEPEGKGAIYYLDKMNNILNQHPEWRGKKLTLKSGQNSWQSIKLKDFSKMYNAAQNCQ